MLEKYRKDCVDRELLKKIKQQIADQMKIIEAQKESRGRILKGIEEIRKKMEEACIPENEINSRVSQMKRVVDLYYPTKVDLSKLKIG